MTESSPLETLAAFAITFIAGAAVAMGIAEYGKWMKKKGFRSA